MAFSSSTTAQRFLEEHADPLKNTLTELLKTLNAPIAQLTRCMGYDSQTHPLTRLTVEWKLNMGPTEVRAFAFDLRKTEGAPKEAFSKCFSNAFARPIVLPPALSKSGEPLQYVGLAPWTLQHDI